MQVIDMTIQALNFKLSLAQHEYIERRLSYALGEQADQISAVKVWLSEAKDADVELDRHCIVQVFLKDARQVIIENAEADFNIAVHRAADQASWKVARRLARRRLHYQGTSYASSPLAVTAEMAQQM